MLNCVAIMGRLAADPQLRQTATGKSVASFRIACDRGRKDSSGQMQVDWLDVVAWGKLADFVYKWFGKGQLIAVSGRLQSRTYQDKNGNNRTVVEIMANTLDFAGRKDAAGTQQGTAYAAPVQHPAGGLDEDPYAVISDDEGDLPF